MDHEILDNKILTNIMDYIPQRFASTYMQGIDWKTLPALWA